MRLRTNSLAEDSESPLRLRHNSISSPDEIREASAASSVNKPSSVRSATSSPRGATIEPFVIPLSFRKSISKNSNSNRSDQGNQDEEEDDDEDEDNKDAVNGPTEALDVIPFDDEPSNAELPDDDTRRDHLFLFCLCDMRQAVIVLDIVGIALGVLDLISVIATFNDDVDNEEEAKVTSFYGSVGLEVAGIVCNISGLIGAIKFKICMLQIALFWGFIDGVFLVYDSHWRFLPLYILLFYSHAVLIYELQEGMITPETYRPKCCLEDCKNIKRRRIPSASPPSWDEEEGVEVTSAIA